MSKFNIDISVIDSNSEYDELIIFLKELNRGVVTKIDDLTCLCSENNSNDTTIFFISDKDIENEQIDHFLTAQENGIFIIIAGSLESQSKLDLIKKGWSDVIVAPITKNQLCEVLDRVARIYMSKIERIKNEALIPIYELSEKFLEAIDAKDVYSAVIDIVQKVVNAQSISLMMFDESSKELQIVTSYGLEHSKPENIRVKPGERISGWVFENGEPIILNKETQHESKLSRYLERSDIISSISFPLINNNRTIGVLNVSKTDSGNYSIYEISILKIITRQAILALDTISTRKRKEDELNLKTLFQQYVSPEVAELLLAKHKNLSDIGDVENLTVLFADIRNFTILVQMVEPKILRVFLNSFFDIFADNVYAARGTLDKFMGDAALVFFGAPVVIKSPCKTAVETAITISQKFEELRRIWAVKEKCFDEIGLGIGISKGDMFLGNVGSSRRFDYTVIGTDVNVAQRMASEADSGQILLTSHIYNEVASQFDFKEEGNRKLRSMEKKIKIFSLIY